MSDTSGAKPEQSLRVFIAEDHELTRMGLRFAIQDHTRLALVGESGDGLDAWHQIQTLKPDLVLMDIELPELDGIAVTRKIKENLPEIKVVMLTSKSQEDQVFTAFSAGADGYCLKDIKLEKLFQVMEMVYEGGIWLDPPIAGFIIKRATSAPKPSMPASHKITGDEFGASLTDREFETLSLIVAGKSNKEIAECMGVSMNTIKTYVGKIIQKLAVDDRTQAAVKALQSGLVVPGQD
jgi:DNA-binding NarL/FixJ family response regulator